MERIPQPHPVPRVARLPRIAIGGILHETNTFAPNPTTLGDFAERTHLAGAAMIDAGTGSHSALGGAIAAANGQATLVPTLFTSAMPGGPVTDATFASLAADLTGRIRQAHSPYPKLDGIVLLLHGAMVTGSDPDPEGTLLTRIRDIVGRHLPVAVVVDSHANLSQRMVDLADLIVGYQQYPHVDTWHRGHEAMTLCLELVRTGTRPITAFRKLPLLMPLVAQSTDPGMPLAPLLERADFWRTQPGIVSISVVPGFPYSDVPDAGASVIVHGAPGNSAQVAEIADDLAHSWWNLRDRFEIEATPLDDLPAEPPPGLTVLADIADNPGAGASSDSTHILHRFLDLGLGDAAFATIADSAAVTACHEAGIGALLDIGIGGRATSHSGNPAWATWRVDHLGNGIFTNEGPMATNAVSRIGRTATVRAGGISVILSERRAQALDPSVFRAGGIEPERCRWLVVKSSVHYRAAFRTMATTMIDVECPGLSPSNLRSLTYNRLRCPIVPLDAPDSPAVTVGERDRAHA
jgi:microcystin degradation protein MlrC